MCFKVFAKIRTFLAINVVQIAQIWVRWKGLIKEYQSLRNQNFGLIKNDRKWIENNRLLASIGAVKVEPATLQHFTLRRLFLYLKLFQLQCLSKKVLLSFFQ